MTQDIEMIRIANATTEPEEHDDIEITPEMIEAGESVLLSRLGAPAIDYSMASELAAGVYRAMVSVYLSAHGLSHLHNLRGQ
jgi:hypothetical protein